MRLIIVRHGETKENAEKIIQGQTLGSLNERGREQAANISKRLKYEKIDVIISSDLERTRDTATIIAKNYPGVEMEYTPLLREKNLTTFEGKSVDEYKEARKNSGLPRHLYKTPGGESYADMRERAEEFLNQIMDRYKEKTVMVVSHGGLIKALLSAALNEPIEEMSRIYVPNTAISILEVKRDHKFEARMINSITGVDDLFFEEKI